MILFVNGFPFRGAIYTKSNTSYSFEKREWFRVRDDGGAMTHCLRPNARTETHVSFCNWNSNPRIDKPFDLNWMWMRWLRFDSNDIKIHIQSTSINFTLQISTMHGGSILLIVTANGDLTHKIQFNLTIDTIQRCICLVGCTKPWKETIIVVQQFVECEFKREPETITHIGVIRAIRQPRGLQF